MTTQNKPNNKVEETPEHMLTWLRGKLQAFEEIEDGSEHNEEWRRILQEFEGMLASAYEQGVRDENNRVIEIAKDWFTKAPKYRTKENLVQSLKNN